MVEEPENLMLRYLINMDGKLDRIVNDLHDVKLRVTAVQEGFAGVHRRMDRFEVRLDKIGRRLEIVEA